MSPQPATQKAPNIPLGNSQAIGFTTRTGVQLITGGFIIEGIEAFNLYTFTEAQSKWSILALTLLLGFLQNFFEQRRNRRFIGPAPIPATKPEAGHLDWQTALLATFVAIVVYLIMSQVFEI